VLDSTVNFGDAAEVSYPGGKNGAGVYQTIINRMPPHPVYIEPFLGGAAILRLKQPAALNVGVDLDAAAIARCSEWARAGSGHAKKNSEGGLRRRPTPKTAISDRQFRFHRGDGIAFLKSYHFTGQELVYCDPPYMMETRTRSLYQFEMTNAQHAELLRVLKGLKCRVMISGYWTRLYHLELTSWNVARFEAMTRGGRTATEYLWFNFPEPLALHDYRYLGEDFRERERIKRKKLRWVKRLERMPMLERRCLLEAIASLAGNGDSAGRIAASGDGGRRACPEA
jgi:hypothetical protein